MIRPSRGNWPILLIAAGFTAWATVFLVLYGAQAIGCRLAWDRIVFVGGLSFQRIVLITLYMSALLGLVFLWWWLRRQTSEVEHGAGTRLFLMRVSSYAALAALGAAAFCFAGIFWLLAC